MVASGADFYFDNFFSAFTEKEQRSLLGEPAGSAASVYGNNLRIWERSSGDLLKRLLYTDLQTFLLEGNMMQDNVSMAASLEARVPFLDHELVEFAYNIPPQFQTHGLSGKRILKETIAPSVLPDVLFYTARNWVFPRPGSFGSLVPKAKLSRNCCSTPEPPNAAWYVQKRYERSSRNIAQGIGITRRELGAC